MPRKTFHEKMETPHKVCKLKSTVLTCQHVYISKMHIPLPVQCTHQRAAAVYVEEALSKIYMSYIHYLPHSSDVPTGIGCLHDNKWPNGKFMLAMTMC